VGAFRKPISDAKPETKLSCIEGALGSDSNGSDELYGSKTAGGARWRTARPACSRRGRTHRQRGCGLPGGRLHGRSAIHSALGRQL